MRVSIFLLSTLLATAGFAAAKKEAKMKTETAENLLPGKWVMHIYLRDKAGSPRLFDDEMEIGKEGSALAGTLVVPKAFTVKLEKIETKGRHFAFEIEANEGRGAFRVRYEGDFHPEDDRTFIGYGTITAPERSLLGGFVGQRLP